MMKKKYLGTLIGVACLSASTMADAQNLVEVYQQALTSDPTFQQAQAETLSAGQNVPISRAFLLPQFGASGNSLYNSQENKTKPNTTIPGFTSSSKGNFDYDSHQYDLNLSQTLFDYTAWSGLKQAKTTVKAANASYAASAQELIARVSSAYFDVLLAEDTLRFTQAEKRATYRQLDQVTQQYKVGLVPITGVYQAQAEYDLIVAQEISAKNDIVNKKENLRAITGEYYEKLAGLKSQVPLITPTPNNVEEWVDTSNKQNWSLQAARYNAQAAQEEVGIQRSGHLPVVNAVGQYDYQKTGKSPGGKIDAKTASVGVQIDFPIFEGFFVTSSTKKAAYDYQAQLDIQERTNREVMNNTRQSYNNVMAGISKIKADKQAIISNQSSLESTIEGYKVGTQTMLDILDAQQELFNAQRQYAADQYAYLNATIALKRAAGTLSANDLEEINNWLTESSPTYSQITVDNLKDLGTLPEPSADPYKEYIAKDKAAHDKEEKPQVQDDGSSSN